MKLDTANCAAWNSVLYATIVTAFLIFFTIEVHSQGFNNDPTMGFIDNSFTKSPEVAALGRYGEVPVDEFTGTTSISIPLYTVKSRNLSLPLSLGYHASGIKVNQEATWVGLGWDLAIGGRISVNVVGGIDGKGESSFWDSDDAAALYATGSPGTEDYCYYRFSNVCMSIQGTDEVYGCVNDTWRDNRYLIIDLEKVGSLQPDLYSVSFNGNSFTFFKDPLTGAIRYKGEKKKFLIAETASGWRITDDNGIEYFFEQGETSNFYPALTPNTSSAITSWLLTKIKHPLEDEILLSYTNYGLIYPTPANINNVTYLNGNTTVSSVSYQQTQITNQYLTRIETDNLQMDFILDTRLDLSESGARKLSQINFKNKHTNTVFKKIMFEYDYFESASSQRLRLNRLIQSSGSSEIHPESEIHTFEYDTTITLPDKTSFSQDHWGFYNGKSNGSNLIPSISSLLNAGILNSHEVCGVLGTSGGVTSAACRDFPLDFSADRSPNTTLMKAGMLKKITYPTRGYSVMTYEPHVSAFNFNPAFVGGGLRTKRIESFDETDKKISVIEYEYLNETGNSSGSYMGKIQYHKVSNVLAVEYVDGSGLSHVGTFGLWTYNSNGNINELGYAVAYSRVIKIEWNADKSKFNGKTIKTYNLLASQDCFTTSASVPRPNIPAVPYYGNGKPLTEKFYDDSGNLLKEKQYSYTFLDFESTITDVKIENGSRLSTGANLYSNYSTHSSWGRFTLYFIPVKSYVMVMDSTIELTYKGVNALKTTSFYSYNTDYQVSEKGMITSENTMMRTAFQYPKNRVSQGITNPYSQMVARNILSTVIEEQYFLDVELLSKNITVYKEWYSNIILPELVQYQYKSHIPETRIRYLNYNSFGNLLCAQQENGMPVTYLWGYNGMYPIAEIKNATYDQVAAVVTESTIAQLFDEVMSDAQLRSTLHSYLRTSMTNAQVITYTFAPLIGITSKTDSNNQTTFYEYDELNRLRLVKDHDGNILKRYTYHLKD